MSFRNIYVDALFVAALALLAALGLANAQRPVGMGWGHDELLHLQFHFLFKDRVKANLEVTGNVLQPSLRKPFLPYAWSTFVSFARPTGYSAALLANAIWVWLWLYVLYRAGRGLVGPAAAFAAVGLLVGPSEFRHLYIHLGNEGPACFWTAAILAYLGNGMRFRRFRAWPVLGLMLGLGLVSKPTVALFVGPGIALVFLTESISALRLRRWTTVAGIVAGAAVTLGLALWIWSAGVPRFWDLVRELAHGVQAESTIQAKPFLTLNQVTLAADWHRVFGHWYFILLVAGTVVAPFTMRGKEHRVWLVGYLVALATFIRAPQSSSYYAYPLVVVPLWAALRAVVGSRRHYGREAFLLFVGVAMLLGQEMRFPEVTPDAQARTRLPWRLTEMGRRVAAEIDLGNRSNTSHDLFFIDQCDPPLEDWPYFLLIPLVDSPHVSYVHYQAGGPRIAGPVFDDPMRQRRDRIGYLLSCGGTGSLDDFTAAWKASRANMGDQRWILPPVPEDWPRFAGVKPQVLRLRDGHRSQTWYFWRADRYPGVTP